MKHELSFKTELQLTTLLERSTGSPLAASNISGTRVSPAARQIRMVRHRNLRSKLMPEPRTPCLKPRLLCYGEGSPRTNTESRRRLCARIQLSCAAGNIYSCFELSHEIRYRSGSDQCQS